ncbi:MAG: hypothetical protein JNM72_14215 [Deltaproteobacteria bacterium]|jgi:hypothetical protein|nr:hypothetical protein [Deltaproteobacteria bacterium]
MTTPALQLFAAYNLVAGAAMALVAASPFAGRLCALFTLIQPEAAGADGPTLRWIAGLAGGVWAGWGAMMLGLTRGRSPAWALRAGLLVWFTLDGLASVANGAALNVGVNLGLLVPGLVLLRGAR